MSPLVASINPLAMGTLHESGDGVFPGTDGLARVPDGGEPMDQMFVLQANSPGTTNQPRCPSPAATLCYQGYDYATVLIGDQCWFAENLRSENYENGDAIPAGLSSRNGVTTTPAPSLFTGKEAALVTTTAPMATHATTCGR